MSKWQILIIRLQTLLHLHLAPIKYSFKSGIIRARKFLLKHDLPLPGQMTVTGDRRQPDVKCHIHAALKTPIGAKEYRM